jgi:hypothetical protein
MADLTTLTAELAGMKQKMVDRLVAQGDETIQPDDTMQTIVDHFDNLRTKIVNQDKEITANGEYTADEGYTGLGKVTVDVKAEPVPKYGATVDTFLGDVDANGVLQSPTGQYDLVFDGIKEISSQGLANAFTGKKNIKTASFPDLETLGASALSGAFKDSSIESISIPKLKKIDTSSALYLLAQNSRLKSLDLSSLEEVTTSYGLSSLLNTSMYYTAYLEEIDIHNLKIINAQSAAGSALSPAKIPILDLRNLNSILQSNAASGFSQGNNVLTFCDLRKLEIIDGYSAANGFLQECRALERVNVDSLKKIKQTSATANMFSYNTKLSKISFPSLIEVDVGSFCVNATVSLMFNSCTALTEIHFRADAQSVIEGLTGYSSKFGATNATIFFDLIGTITVNGVAYARNEPNSIYVEYDKTYVAWADESGNIVYTTAGTEPAVGTVVYSDEGTTQVGTVSAVA